MRAVDVDELEAPSLVRKVEQDASRVADELAHARGVDELDVPVERRLQPRACVGRQAGAPLEGVDTGQLRF